MFYKLSQNIPQHAINDEFKLPLKFPNLYENEIIINGLDESNLWLITEDDRKIISLGIWGIMPRKFSGDWQTYQQTNNSLNQYINTLKTSLDHNMFQYKKCVVIVTGFFTSFVKNGEIYTYYVYQKNASPFLLAGIYNTLDDGYNTCSLLLTKANTFISKINNVNNCMPLIVDKNKINAWMDSSFSELNENSAFSKTELYAHTVGKEFFNNDILFDSVLDHVNYKELPNYSYLIKTNQ